MWGIKDIFYRNFCYQLWFYIICVSLILRTRKHTHTHARTNTQFILLSKTHTHSLYRTHTHTVHIRDGMCVCVCVCVLFPPVFVQFNRRPLSTKMRLYNIDSVCRGDFSFFLSLSAVLNMFFLRRFLLLTLVQFHQLGARRKLQKARPFKDIFQNFHQ